MKTMTFPLPEPATARTKKAGPKKAVKVEHGEDEEDKDGEDGMEEMVSEDDMKVTKANGKGKTRIMAKSKEEKIKKGVKSTKTVASSSDEEDQKATMPNDEHSIMAHEGVADYEEEELDEDVA